MRHYDISVIYTISESNTGKIPEFLHQSVSDDRIQMIPVFEDDLYDKRKQSRKAIGQAEGTYTILLDEGDLFEEDFLECLMTRLEDTGYAFSMPLQKCRHPKKSPQYFAANNGQDVCIDIRESQLVFPMELHGVLFMTKVLQQAWEEYGEKEEPEKQMLLSIMEKYPVFWYAGTKCLEYMVPREGDGEYDLRCHQIEWYFEPFEHVMLPLLEKQKKADRVLQTAALYMILIRIHANLDNRNKHVLEEKDVYAFTALCSRLLRCIDTELIVRPKEACFLTSAGPKVRLFLMRLKKSDFSYYPDVQCQDDGAILLCDGEMFCELSKIPVALKLLQYENGCLEIDGSYLDLLNDKNFSVSAQFDGKKYALEYNGRYSLAKCFGVSFTREKTFHVTIPVAVQDKERILQFVAQIQGREYVMNLSFPSQYSRFAKGFGYAYWCFGSNLAFWRKNSIHIIKKKKIDVLRKEVMLWKQMWEKFDGAYREQLPVKILNFLLRPYFSRRKIWLFLDKIYKGGDSAEYLYRYAKTKQDGIQKYYLLDRNSADYDRMRKEGYRPLIRGSLKHRLVFLNADIVIASNSTVCAFNDYNFSRSLPIRGDLHFDVACVQHGMSVQKIAVAQQRLRDNTRLYFCASKYEIENLSKPVYDYNGYDALKLTGVPRYDGLINRAERILVISPTWRMQSAMPVSRSEGVSRDYNPHFKETSYYKVYNALINHPRLLEAARRYQYRIQYVLHPIISPQCEDFEKNDVVEIIPSIGSMSYEKIFCEGALMVTDFSGVQFDFAYMRKPVVYFHSQEVPQHYEEGTFFYETMGFGEICRTSEELVDVLCRYMQSDCVMPELYRKRADDFFAYSDQKNCERIYPELLKYTEAREKDRR